MIVSWFQPSWLHEISQSALAAAVVALGLVILLELRSIKMLRRSLDSNLGRVFEQLDLMRFEHLPAEGADAQAATGRATASTTAAAAPAAGNAYAAAATFASSGMQPEEIAQRCGLAAGEARLLVSLAAARTGRRADA